MITVDVKVPDFTKLLDAVLPTRAQLGAVLDELRTEVVWRAFPASGPGRDVADQPYSPYGVYVAYISRRAVPRPVGTPTRGGHGRTVRYSQGWGGGADSYRGALGLSTGRSKNLRLTGTTANSFRARTITRYAGQLRFTGRGVDRAALLNSIYHFGGLTINERALLAARYSAAMIGNISAVRSAA